MDIKFVVDLDAPGVHRTPPRRRLPPVPRVSVDSPSSSGSSSLSNSPAFSPSELSTFSGSSSETSPSSSPVSSPHSSPPRTMSLQSPSQKPSLLSEPLASPMLAGKRVSRPLPRVPEGNPPGTPAHKVSLANLKQNPGSTQAHLLENRRPFLLSAVSDIPTSSFNSHSLFCQNQGQLVCKKCFLDVTSGVALVPLNAIPPGSRPFRGFSGKAALFTEVYNVNPSQPRVQLMSTGAHTMQDAFCSGCATLLGWRIVRAHEKPEKWKEGRWLMELECLRLKPSVPEDVAALDEGYNWVGLDEPTRKWEDESATVRNVGGTDGYPYPFGATSSKRGRNVKVYKGNASAIHLPLTVHG